MAEKRELLDAISVWHEDVTGKIHELYLAVQDLNTQMREYATLSASNQAKVDGACKDIDEVAAITRKNSNQVAEIRGQWKLALLIIVPAILTVGGLVFVPKLIGGE